MYNSKLSKELLLKIHAKKFHNNYKLHVVHLFHFLSFIWKVIHINCTSTDCSQLSKECVSAIMFLLCVTEAWHRKLDSSIPRNSSVPTSADITANLYMIQIIIFVETQLQRIPTTIHKKSAMQITFSFKVFFNQQDLSALQSLLKKLFWKNSYRIILS